jgi:hypothetical protein
MLCLTIICLCFAVGSLYRAFGRPTANTLPTLAWPLKKMKPGEMFHIVPYLSSSIPPERLASLSPTAFYLFATGDEDASPTIISLSIKQVLTKHQTPLTQLPGNG